MISKGERRENTPARGKTPQPQAANLNSLSESEKAIFHRNHAVDLLNVRGGITAGGTAIQQKQGTNRKSHLRPLIVTNLLIRQSFPTKLIQANPLGLTPSSTGVRRWARPKTLNK